MARLKSVLAAATAVVATGCVTAPAAHTPADAALSPVAGAAAALAEPRAPVAEFASAGRFLRCLRERDVTVASAHRGGVEPGYPENALETIAHTLSQGAFIVEIDVRETADGVLVLLHDETLERTTTGEGVLADSGYAALTELRLVDNDGAETEFAIPELGDVLDWSRGRALLQLDVKEGVEMADVVAAIADADAFANAAVIAYTVEDALAAVAADPRVTVSVGVENVATLDALVAGGLAPEHMMAWTGVGDIRPELWAGLHARDVSVAFGALWTIDAEVEETGDASRYAELADMGVDVIATDLHLTAYGALETRQDTVAGFAACSAAP